MIIISLFDEVEFDDRSSGGYLDDESAIRREKRFLGSVSLPFQVNCRINTTSGRSMKRKKPTISYYTTTFIPIFVVGMPTMACVWNMERGAFCGMLLQLTATGAVRKGSEAKWFSFPPFSKVGAAPESRTAQPGEIHHPSQVCGTVASSLGFLS